VRRSPLPKIEPIRPVRRTTVPVGTAWLYELKLDGFRGVLSLQDGRGSFISKMAKPMPRFRELADSVARALTVQDAILDGEIIVMTDAGPDFDALFWRRGNPAFAAFDLLWLDGRDLRAQPLWRRKRALKKLLEATPIPYVEPVDDPSLFTAAAEHDLEGIVAKRRGDPYASTSEWVKVKHAGYTRIQGRHELFDKRRR
jgi:bifunctional non-homologous end joining protein LigD